MYSLTVGDDRLCIFPSKKSSLVRVGVKFRDSLDFDKSVVFNGVPRGLREVVIDKVRLDWYVVDFDRAQSNTA